MRLSLNIYAFILSIVCILLFLIVSLTGTINYAVFDIHPLNLVLYITLTTFVLGILGFASIDSWKGIVISTITLFATAALSLFLIFIILLGSLLS